VEEESHLRGGVRGGDEGVTKVSCNTVKSTESSRRKDQLSEDNEGRGGGEGGKKCMASFWLGVVVEVKVSN
jgi:hypothetical protein